MGGRDKGSFILFLLLACVLGEKEVRKLMLGCCLPTNLPTQGALRYHTQPVVDLCVHQHHLIYCWILDYIDQETIT